MLEGGFSIVCFTHEERQAGRYRYIELNYNAFVGKGRFEKSGF